MIRKIGSTVMLLGLALSVGTLPLWPQARTATPQQTGTPATGSEPTGSGNARRHDRSFAHELAHETREEVGEEKVKEKDETVQFRESPSVKFVARHTGLSVSKAALFSTLLNFGILAALIVWGLVKFLPRAFRSRTAAIQQSLLEAQKVSEEARRRLAQIESRLAKLDTEIAGMQEAAEKEFAAEEARIKEATEEDARKIIESAEQEIAASVKNARRNLTSYAADLAVALAQKQIRVDPATDQALVRTFAADLGATASNGKDGH